MRIVSTIAGQAGYDTPQQRRVLIEMVIVGALSSVFLALFPRRPIGVDLGLALFALSLVLLNADFTRIHIWGQWPLDAGPAGRLRGVLVTISLTILVVLTL